MGIAEGSGLKKDLILSLEGIVLRFLKPESQAQADKTVQRRLTQSLASGRMG